MLQEIVDMFPESEILKADGYDNCILGFDYSWEGNIRLIYSVNKILKELVADGMNEEDAIEHFEFNMRGGYVGDQTPIWCQDDLIDDERGSSMQHTWGNVFDKYMTSKGVSDLHDFIEWLYNNYEYPYPKNNL